MENQKEVNIEEYVDQQRWLLNNGLISDSVKNQLFFCGSIVHRDVQAVELKLNPEKRIVEYIVYVDSDLLKKIDLYHSLSTSKTIFGMWRFKRLLKKEGSLDFQNVLSKFVADFCGPKWTTKVQVIDFAKYTEALGEQGGDPGNGQSADKLPD